MARIPLYATVVTLNEGMFIYTAIDTNTDGNYESRNFTLGTLRLALYDTNSVMFRGSKGVNIASATALPIGLDGNFFNITGTTAITSFSDVKVGTEIVLEFDAVLTLTHHATDLILPGGLNIVTAAGDKAGFIQYATDDWKCLYYTRAAVRPSVAGSVFPVYMDAVPQALSGPGAVDILSPVTNFTSAGATDALTLVDSTLLGQIKVLNHEVDAGGYILTPVTLSGGTTITVTDVGVSITLMWTVSGWRLVGQTGVAVIA